MSDPTSVCELVRLARSGDQDSMGNLAVMFRPRLYAYVYRILLRSDISEDIVQESFMEMVKSINSLRSPESFWAWLKGIAYNKILTYYTQYYRHKTLDAALIDKEYYLSRADNIDDGLSHLTQKNLKRIIFEAMWQLKPVYRSVICMRCYEQMEYSSIAQTMGRTELNVRVLFCRAKKSLLRQLIKNGFGKAFFVASLTIFAKITSQQVQAAEVVVSQSSLQAGFMANTLAAATGRGVLVAAIVIALLSVGKVYDQPIISKFKAVTNTASDIKNVLPKFGSVGKSDPQKDDIEHWFYYPDGIGNAVMFKAVYRSPKGYQGCYILQDDTANYSYDPNERTLYLKNYRHFNKDLTLIRLPGDNMPIRSLIAELNSQADNYQNFKSNTAGVLLILRKANQANSFTCIQNFHAIREEYFQYDFPRGATIIDNTDEMHKRGWAFFTIEGRINNQNIIGTGKMPFVYKAWKKHKPWIDLKIGSDILIRDGSYGAKMYAKAGRILGRFAPGLFFDGLNRNWMGLHTIDTVRRDAQRYNISHQIDCPDITSSATVTLTKDQITIEYSINLMQDVIERITFYNEGEKIGQMNFTYFQDETLSDKRFTEKSMEKENPDSDFDSLWLFHLANGDLNKESAEN